MAESKSDANFAVVGADGPGPAGPGPGQKSLSERLAEGLRVIEEGDLSPKAIFAIENEFIEVLGLMVAAGQSDYMAALFGSLDSSGPCSYPGYPLGLSPSGAALAGGVGIHGEDFDDTLEGAPIRVAAMVFPAVLAAGERHGRSGREVFLGAAAGMEAICRINRLAPGLIHSRGFHPVGVLGPFGSAAGTSRTLNLGPKAMATAFGLAGSLSSGLL